MSRRTLALLAAALLAAVVVVAGSAIAAKPATKTQKIEGVIHAAVVQDQSGKAVIAGTVTDKYTGRGAIVYDNPGLGPKTKTPFHSFSKHGSFKGVGTSDNTLNPDGTVTISNCSIKITGGGGDYRGATGSATCSGSGDAQGRDTINYKGSAKIPRK